MEPTNEDVNYVTALADAQRQLDGIDARIIYLESTQKKISPHSVLMVDANKKLVELNAEKARLVEHIMQLQIDWPV